MNLASLLRAVSLTVSGGALASLLVGSGAFAQNIPIAVVISQPQPAVSMPTQPDLPLASAGSSNKALNWSGYTATGGTYTSVSGSWIVPTVANTGVTSVADATWVGIGGVVSDDLIQAGTEAIPASDGTMVYRAWMETLPDNSKVIPLTISPGDAVSVSITEASQGVWEVSFDDATTGKTYQTNVQYDSSLSSADWIEEMPVEVGGIVGLDDFGTVDFTAGYAIKNAQAVTIDSSGAKPLTMDNRQGMAVAQPSELGAGGSSFSVTRTNAPSTPLALSGDGVSAVAIDTAPSTLLPGGRSSAGGYRTRSHRGTSVYRVYLQF